MWFHDFLISLQLTNPQNYSPHFTHMTAFTVCKFWSAFYPLMVRRCAFCTSPPRPFCMCQLLHFCQLLSKLSIDLELEYIFGKPMKCTFQWYIVYTEILSTFHTQVEYISVTKYAIETIGSKGGQTTPKNPPLPLEARGPHLIHECLGDPTHHPKWQLNRCMHFCTTMQQSPHWLQWDTQIYPKNCSFPSMITTPI